MRARVPSWVAISVLGAASVGVAQPPVPQPPARAPIDLKGIGDPAQLTASRVQVQAGQLEMDIHALRVASRRLALPPGVRLQVGLAGDRAIQSAQRFRILTTTSASTAELLAAHAGLDQSVEQFAAAIQPYAAGDSAVAQTLRRARLSDERLHGLMAPPEPGAEFRGRRLARVAASLEVNLAELTAAVTDTPAVADRELAKQLGQASSDARQVARLAASGVTDARVTALTTRVVAGWQAVTPRVTPIAAQNARVRLEAAQVDRLVGELARVAGVAVPLPPAFGIVTPTSRVFVVGAGEGGGPRVRIFHELNGPSTDFFAYDPSYRGGVRVATADLNGDGFPDIVTAPGRDTAPVIRVFDGRTLTLLTQFVAYDPPYDLGTFVAAADLSRDGRAFVAVGPGDGGPPHVKVIDIAAGKVALELYPYGKDLRCGVRVALADVDGDGVADLITAPGPDPGIGPQVKVCSGIDGRLLREFNAFDEPWRGGLHVAAADLTRNGKAELIVGTDAGGPASVRVFDPLAGRLLADWRPYGTQFRGGVRVATFDVNSDGVPDIVAAPGVGSPNLPVRAYDGRTRRPLGEFVPFEGNFAGGAYVGGR